MLAAGSFRPAPSASALSHRKIHINIPASSVRVRTNLVRVMHRPLSLLPLKPGQMNDHVDADAGCPTFAKLRACRRMGIGVKHEPLSQFSRYPTWARNGCPILSRLHRERVGYSREARTSFGGAGLQPCHLYPKRKRASAPEGFVSAGSLLLQSTLNRRNYLRRIRCRRRLKPVHRLAVATDQKLRKVPLDLAAEVRIGRLIRQVLVQRCLVCAQQPRPSTSSGRSRGTCDCRRF